MKVSFVMLITKALVEAWSWELVARRTDLWGEERG